MILVNQITGKSFIGKRKIDRWLKMVMDICYKIDKCYYCNKKAEYFWFRNCFFNIIKIRDLCNEHRLERKKLK